MKGPFKFQLFFTNYKTPILYTSGSMAKALSQLVAGLVIAKFVSPHDLGLWTTINLALVYSTILQAGLINGLNRELPYAFGTGANDKAKKMAGSVQTFTIFSSAIILIIGLSFFFFVHFQNEKIKYGILAIVLVIIMSYYQNYLLSTFRARKYFLKLSVLQLVYTVVNLTALILVAYYSYYGLITKAGLVIFIYVTLLHISRPLKVGLIWDKVEVLKLIKVGIPIFGLAYIVSIASTADKLLLLKYSDLTNVGLYSFGFYALTTFSLLSTSIASYIYPTMTYKYGKNNDKIELWKYVKKISLIMLVVQFPLATTGYYIIPIVITRYFPSYILSISPMQILLFAGLFQGCVVGVTVLQSIKSWKYLILYQLIFAALLISFPYLGIQLFENRIEGAAYGVLIGSFLNLISGLYLTYYALKRNQREKLI